MIQLEEKRIREFLTLNNRNVPDVGILDEESLKTLLSMTSFLKFVDVEGELVGFIQGLLPDQSYTSLNYRWFSKRYKNFLYIDRVVIHEDHRSKGLGKQLYALAVDFCRQLSIEQVLLEVNTIPPNDGSHAFHLKLGFEPVGEFTHKPGKAVRMYRLGVS